jgi:hypothetical protein
MSAAELLILEQFKSGKLTSEEVAEKFKKLTIGDLKKHTYKVSPKGAISFYGLRKMPITLYKQELQTIIDLTKEPAFEKFLVENSDRLSVKDTSQ